MSHELREHVSYCLVGDHPVFLDLQEDRYFRLSVTLERAFAACAGGEGTLAEFQILIDHGILIEASEGTGNISPAAMPRPERSALEMRFPPARLSIKALIEVTATTYLTHRTLRTRPLRQILEEVVAYRQRRAALPGRSGNKETRLLDAAAAFRQARLYVPIAPTCLLDSIALVMYLARRGVHANITIGVNSNPFSAHAWVQSGSLVLNETVGESIGHVPIRVV